MTKKRPGVLGIFVTLQIRSQLPLLEVALQ
jgi:hypothetical protein